MELIHEWMHCRIFNSENKVCPVCRRFIGKIRKLFAPWDSIVMMSYTRIVIFWSQDEWNACLQCFLLLYFFWKFMFSASNCAQLDIRLLETNSPRLIANSKIMLLSQTIWIFLCRNTSNVIWKKVYKVLITWVVK
jgi:hypothetical protein